MQDSAVEMVRSLVREMILSEAQTPGTGTQLIDIDFQTMFRESPASGQDVQIAEILAYSNVSHMVIAGVEITRGDVELLTSSGADIDIMARLRKIPNFRQISRRAPDGGTLLLSTGEIEESAINYALEKNRSASPAYTTSYLVRFVCAKISAVMAFIDEVSEFQLSLLERAMVNQAEVAANDKNETLTDKQIKEAMDAAAARHSALAAAATAAINRLAGINEHMMNYRLGLLAHDGYLLSTNGKLKDARDMPTEDRKEYLHKHWGGNAVGAFMTVADVPTTPLSTPGSKERVFRGTGRDVSGMARGDTPMLVAAIRQFNELLSMQGLSAGRGEMGKGIVGYDAERGRLDRNVRDPEMAREILRVADMMKSVEDSVIKQYGGRLRSPERMAADIEAIRQAQRKAILRKAGEEGRRGQTVVTLGSGVKMRVEEPGSEAEKLRAGTFRRQAAKLMSDVDKSEASKQAADAAVGLTAGAGDVKRVEAATVVVKGRISTVLDTARHAITDGGAEAARVKANAAMRRRDFVLAAFEAFVRPIAKALTESRFCDLDALAKLSAGRVRDASSITSALRRRRSAAALMSSSDAMGVYEDIVSVSSRSRSDELVDLFAAERVEGVQRSLIVTPSEVGSALTALRAKEDPAGQVVVFGPAVSSLMAVLAAVLREAQSVDPDQVSEIEGMMQTIGGSAAQVVSDVLAGGGLDMENPLHYIIGTKLEPIPLADARLVSSQHVSYREAAATAAAQAAEPGSAEEAEAIAAGRAGIARRVVDIELEREKGEKGPQAYTTPEPEYYDEPEERIGRGGEEGAFGAFGLEDLDERRLFEALRRALVARAGAQKAAGR